LHWPMVERVFDAEDVGVMEKVLGWPGRILPKGGERGKSRNATGVLPYCRPCLPRGRGAMLASCYRKMMRRIVAKSIPEQRDLSRRFDKNRYPTAVLTKNTKLMATAMLLLLGGRNTPAQRARGELRLEVHDPQGAMLAADAALVSELNQFHRTFQVAADGRYSAQDLPFGVYRLSLSAEGFAPWTNLVEIRSEVPVRVAATMGVAPVTTQVQVNDSATLVDPYRTGTVYSVGRQAIGEEAATQPGRDLFDLVAEEPGWLFEANGVLHPRGSEYDVQFVVNGLPLTQNRSPAFAPSFDTDDVESIRVLTASYPAEYGRKLGGVVEVTTEKDVPAGLHGQVDASGGSFAMARGSARISYTRGRNRFSLNGSGFHTDRYLDPPVLQNYTNRGNADGFSAAYERAFSDRDRLQVTVTHNQVRFLVPNELVEQNPGQQQLSQRQDIVNSETSGQVFFQHAISADLLLSLSGSVRDAHATVVSNPFSRPVIVFQDRGYREGYVRADLSGNKGHHNWKTGLDCITNPVEETLDYTITDKKQFDPGTQSPFQFTDRKWDVEPSGYVQDQVHLGHWNVSTGLRFDHYAFLVHESAWSPRFGVSRFIAPLNLLLHASYDRVFQTPALENLLLASSSQLDAINHSVLRLPVRGGRGNFYEGGVTKAFFGKLRLEATVFRRDFRNYSDDDVLLNTGVSFPIAFAKARIIGEELRLELPQWGQFSGYLSYANQSGIGQGPVTGGLFLGVDVANALTDTSQFAVSQDQRNTLSVRVRFQAEKHVWLAMAGQYGSGLPADKSGADPNLLLTQYGTAILNQVNLTRGRVRPSFSLDAAAGAEIYRKEQRSAAVQIQVANLTDRLEVINFASLFSGTAIAPPRSVSARLKLTF
jgi:outer membrane cobalamin receptor